jgi:DNA-nicking Smr family endonuclease
MSYYFTKQTRADEPHEVVDLHGYTTAQTRSVLEDLLHARGSHVRLLVGKGKNSEHGAVLPVFVQNFLRERAVRCEQSHPRDGGSGAIEVFF